MTPAQARLLSAIRELSAASPAGWADWWAVVDKWDTGAHPLPGILPAAEACLAELNAQHLVEEEPGRPQNVRPVAP